VDLDRPEEEAWFAESAMNAYKSFRDKAALSRSMKVCCKIALAWSYQKNYLIYV
jgi:hypothetical protein